MDEQGVPVKKSWKNWEKREWELGGSINLREADVCQALCRIRFIIASISSMISEEYAHFPSICSES